MKHLQILAFNPWKTKVQDVSWGVGYTDDKLYDIIQQVREDYPMHCTTFFFENDMIKTYKPLHRQEKYV